MKFTIEVNDTFKPLINNTDRYLCLWGGAGSGKSYFIACRYILKLLGKTRCNLLVVRNTGKSNRDSTFALLKQIISNYGFNVDQERFVINNGDMRIKCFNGNEVIFAGLDDVEKLKSITFANGELTDIWVEEASEVQERDFNQLDVRLRGGSSKKQIVVSFNPIYISHWLKKFMDSHTENITIHHSTYLDNRFIDDDYKKLLESYKETDPYYYRVYCLGEWGMVSESVFPAAIVEGRMKEVPNPIKKGYFDFNKDLSWKWCDSIDGYIVLYELPKTGTQYVIGGDTASGVGSDYSIAQVLESSTGRQVAVLRNRMDSDLYAKQMYCLGKFYNNALISIEVNFDLYPIKWLEENGYTNQYVREQQDTFTHGIKKAFGFRTDSFTRPRILSQLIEIVREHIELFNDYQTLQEMLTFVRNEKGRPEAMEGEHDDLVMAIAIAHEAANQVVYKKERKTVYSEEEDFFDYGG